MKLRRAFYLFAGGAIAASIIVAAFLAPETDTLEIGAALPNADRLPVLAETTEPARSVRSETNRNAVERATETIGGDDLVRDPLWRDTVVGTGTLTSASQQNRSSRSSVMVVEVHAESGAALEGATKPISEPACWRLTSNLPENFYSVTQDNEQALSGESSARMESTSSRAQFGTLSQTIDASAFAGKRIEFSAFVRLEGVSGGVSLWVLATDVAGGITVSQRLDWIPGSLDWHSRSIVVDVPLQSVALTYAFNLLGEGKLWVDDAHIAALGTVATMPPAATARAGHRGSLVAPEVASLPVSSFNTDFEVWDTGNTLHPDCAA
jgi:hypothetical protein